MKIGPREQKILDDFPCTVLCCYTDGMGSGTGPQRTASGTVFPAGQAVFTAPFTGTAELPECPFPGLKIGQYAAVCGTFLDGSPLFVRTADRCYYAALPVLQWPQLRILAELAECRTYGRSSCIVCGDSAFTAVFGHDDPAELKLTINE